MAVEGSLYGYEPSHVLPIVFAVLIGISLVMHVIQNFRYKFWKITFWMFWGGTVFTTGWILRAVSTYHQTSIGLYIAQSVCIYGGPPIYSAAEYNVLGRLMRYLPMHAPLNPSRVLYFFVYLGILVESITAAGAARIAAAQKNHSLYQSGATLISVGLILQAVVECLFMSMVAYIHHRCVRANMLSSNVRTICIMLYGTSTLILLRCIYRAVEAFATFNAINSCSATCKTLLTHEWFIYVLEAAPMVLYTYWLNIIHPGRFIPNNRDRYLDIDAQTERFGPGWVDKRSTWETFMDPLGLSAKFSGKKDHEEFWLQPDNWPVCEDGSFAQRTATNTGKTTIPVKQHKPSQ